MSDERRPPESAPNPPSRVRPAGTIRKLVLCALAAAPIACGPSSGTGPQQPQPSADAATQPVPAYGVPFVEPGPSTPDYAVEMPTGVEEYAVIQPPDDRIPSGAAEYAAPMPPEEPAVGAYGAPMPRE
jgi:hypothetical protein